MFSSSHPHLISQFFLPVAGPVSFIPKSPRFPSLFTQAVLGRGWQEHSLNPGPACSTRSLPTWYGLPGVGHWSFGEMQSVGFLGSLVSCKNKTKQLQYNVHSFFRSFTSDGRNGLWQSGGKRGSRYSFWGRPIIHSALAPSPTMTAPRREWP